MRSFDTLNFFDARLLIGLLMMLFAVTGVSPASAQLAAGTVRYAKAVGDPTVVRSEPTRNAEVVARLPLSDAIVLESVGVEETEQGAFHRVVPTPESNLSWEVGYVHESELEIGIDRPWQVGGGIYGSLASFTAEPARLSAGGTPVVQNPFGRGGRSPMYSIGLTVRAGKYIPTGKASPWAKLDVEYSLLQGDNEATGVDSTSLSMIRVGLGGDLIYQASPRIDVSIGAIVGGGPVRNELSLTNRQTVTANALFGTIDLLVGVGYGRNFASRPETFRGLRLRLEAGYRFGSRLGDWSYTFEEQESETSITFDGADEPLSLGGPVMRLIIGV